MSFFGWMTGSDDAARAKKRAYGQAMDFNDQGMEMANSAFAPYAEAGRTGMDAMTALMLGGGNVAGRLDFGNYDSGRDPGQFTGEFDLQSDPGYRARMDASRNALNENQFLDGSWGSGPAAKEMASFMQEQASGEADKAYNRALSTYNTRNADFSQDRNFAMQQYLNDLQSITGDVDRQQGMAANMMGTGFNAAGGMANNANMWAQNAGNNALGIGNAAAEGAVNGSFMGGMGALANVAGNVAKAYQGWQGGQNEAAQASYYRGK